MADIKAILKLIEEAAAKADTKAAETAKKYFGITDDPREAGYILPDGRMLDFSGRHLNDAYEMKRGRYVPTDGEDFSAGQRNTEHREISELYDDPDEGLSLLNDPSVVFPDDQRPFIPMSDFMRRTRAIRSVPEMGSFSMMNYPSPRQLAAMKKQLRSFQEYDHPVIEVWDPAFRSLGSVRGQDVRASDMESRLLELVDKYKRYADGGEVEVPAADPGVYNFEDGGSVDRPVTAYDDMDAALEFMQDPSVPMSEKMKLARVVPEIRNILETDQRVDEIGSRSRSLDPTRLIRALVDEDLSRPRAPTGDGGDEAYASQVEDSIMRAIADYEQMTTPKEKLGDKISRYARAVADVAPEVGAGMAKDVMEYATPVWGNMKGAQDFNTHLMQHANAAENGVDPLTANIMLVPNAAMDVMQMLIPFSLTGAGKATQRLSPEAIAKYLE
jgi:hypothetical protein